MKSVLISIHPKWCDLIASGKKTIEVRKTCPKIETQFKCYIYCTQSGKYKDGKSVKNIWLNRGTDKRFIGNGKVIGEFVCDYVYENMSYDCEASCVSVSELKKYANGKPLYGWHISDLKIYDKPKELSEFYRVCDFDKCDNCPHLYVENTPSSYETWCEFDEKIPITRPPQSWCYVEEV